ncbi:unnamed protein product [Caenorhabditis brenneri]
MEENPLELKEQNEQANMNYDNLFEFLDNPNHPTPDPAPTASNYFLKRKHTKAHYPYHCAHCDRKYLTEYAMKRHMRNEHNVNFYKCVTCNEAFSFKVVLTSSTWLSTKFGEFSELKAHLTKDHELDKLGNKRVCKKCGKWKRSWQFLVVHFHFDHFEDEKQCTFQHQINQGFSISNILNSTTLSPEPQSPITSSAPEQSNDAYNQLLFLVMCAYPNVIFSNLQLDPSSSSNSVSASSSASSSESEQNDKTTETLSPDLQQYQ